MKISKIEGGFPIEIESQISKLITYSSAILVLISIGNPPRVDRRVE